MNLIDSIKRYSFTGLTWLVVCLCLGILWQLYTTVYAPLFIQTLDSTTQGSTKYRLPTATVQQAITQLDNKKTAVVDFSDVSGEITALPANVGTTPTTEASSEGIIVGGSAP